MSVSEENPNVFYYPEEDNVLGQHETSLNETNTEEIRDVATNCFCFCHIINSLLTELVRSTVQEDTARRILQSAGFFFRLFVHLAYGSVQETEKRTRPQGRTLGVCGVCVCVCGGGGWHSFCEICAIAKVGPETCMGRK